MSKESSLYSMRAMSKRIGGTNHHAVLLAAYKIGVRTWKAGNMIAVDEIGAKQLTDHFAKNTRNARSA